MSMASCANCGEIFDTDFELEVNKSGDCICDRCWEIQEKENMEVDDILYERKRESGI